jgi:hypothetical protein
MSTIPVALLLALVASPATAGVSDMRERAPSAPSAAPAPSAADATASPEPATAGSTPTPAQMHAQVVEDVARVSDEEPIGRVYDALVLRPIGFAQLVVGAVFLVPSWPVSLLFGEGDFVYEACVGATAEQVFGRPLGQR